MTQTVDQALKDAVFYSDNQPYTLVHLPATAIMASAGVIAEIGEPFCALIIDQYEITLLIPADALTDFSKRLPGHKASSEVYRLITIDVVLEAGLIGFIAKISSALAAVGVSILPFAAFNRDHLFTTSDQFDQAMAALEKLKANS